MSTYPIQARTESETYDKDHHKYEGPDFGNCVHCGLDELMPVHQSAEQWSRETDEVFGS